MHFPENKADCILVKNQHNFIGKINRNIYVGFCRKFCFAEFLWKLKKKIARRVLFQIYVWQPHRSSKMAGVAKNWNQTQVFPNYEVFSGYMCSHAQIMK
jgi:hypothetical protein